MKSIHVAVGVVKRGDEILIAKRPDHVHKGGLWEFPGGKVEPNENVVEALARELNEELGIEIDVNTASPLIRLHHAYPEKTVDLDVWVVEAFSGTPHGRENQAVRWVTLDDIRHLSLPEANQSIVTALRLPEAYMMTGQVESAQMALEKLKRIIEKPNAPGMVRFRGVSLAGEVGEALISLCRQRSTLVVGDHNPMEVMSGIDAIHFSSQHLHQIVVEQQEGSGELFDYFEALKKRGGIMRAFSCHNAEELDFAQKLGADFITLSPVKPTNSHPGAEVLGWDSFKEVVRNAAIPVYALGGLSHEDLARSKRCGAQGIAGIGCWWQE